MAAQDGHVALQAFDKAIALDPQLYHAFFNRGIVRSNRGDRQGALKDFSEAIRLDPTNCEALMRRAQLLQILKNYAGASADMQTARALLLPGDTRRERLDQALGLLETIWRLNPPGSR